MNNRLDIRLQNIKIPRVYQHLLFWAVVYILVAVLYSVQTNFWVSLHNNLYFMPVQIVYYYAIAYWVIPKYLFVKQYLKFGLLLLLLVIVSLLLTRAVAILFVNPHIVKALNVDNPEILKFNSQPFLVQLADKQSMVNALKGVNLIIGFVLAIKLFKMWYERKQAALEAELSALKAQVHPHFLFNTLNNLYALSLDGSPKSPQLILGLSDILRYMLYECNADEVHLEREIFMMQQYVKLEKVRYEDRIDINFTIKGDLTNKLIAPLLILPFIENAFKHGTSEKTGQVWINIDINVTGNHFKLKVANNNPEREPDSDQTVPGHIGLKNVMKRLELLYPATSKLKIMNEDDTFLIVLDMDLNVIKQPETKLVTA
ncbi:sensor histidine kinase [Mucilaginibacter aquaedulcis]|uniref:sensor histidine kinase n=1 Tax=Mucilaginibacter aquaedulcis TaxID=1187081 RepID=UPI0025B40D21|nr:histidine kinase [Mucilaginibacter aquaedulcis]MDN3549909.1 histidine kinase [Mucilaginibacter aquaedulcis]